MEFRDQIDYLYRNNVSELEGLDLLVMLYGV